MKKYIIALVSVIVVLFLAVFLFYENVNIFKGNRVKNPNSYTMEFQSMNQKDSHVMALKAEDVLDIEYEILKGRVDLTIGIDGEKPIYKGTKLEAGSFQVIIPADGDYRITIKAKHAAGTFKLGIFVPEED